MKISKYAKFYVIGSQGILTMIVLGAIGFFIGYKIKKDSALAPIFAVVGILCGLISFISNLLFLLKGEKKEWEKQIIL